MKMLKKVKVLQYYEIVLLIGILLFALLKNYMGVIALLPTLFASKLYMVWNVNM